MFLSLCWIASRPYRLSRINALHINQSYEPKDQSLKFSQIFLRIDDFGELSFFELSILEFFFQKKYFLLHPHKNQSKVLGCQGWDKIVITLISSQKSPTPNISAPSVRYLYWKTTTDTFLLAKWEDW